MVVTRGFGSGDLLTCCQCFFPQFTNIYGIDSIAFLAVDVITVVTAAHYYYSSIHDSYVVLLCLLLVKSFCLSSSQCVCHQT
jgi:hypothetical protein